MITFNVTLFIQLGNFILTTYFLQKLLFRPIIDRIIQRKKEEKQLRDEIILKKQDVENFRDEKTAQLSQFQKDAKTDYPFTPVTSPSSPQPTTPVKVSKPTAAELKELQDKLEERVRHGH